jgi:hypothetical protein
MKILIYFHEQWANTILSWLSTFIYVYMFLCLYVYVKHINLHRQDIICTYTNNPYTYI